MTDDVNLYSTCFICESRYQNGPSRYDGKWLPDYKFSVCNRCLRSNWDGWSPMHEDKILGHLRENDLPAPPRNEKGFLCRDYPHIVEIRDKE